MVAPLPHGHARISYMEELGSGGLGRVRRVKVIATNDPGKPVGSEWACKQLNEVWAEHPTMQERFNREINALKRMSHPNIVSFEGENVNPGRFYLMPLYTDTVRKLIASGRKTGDWRFIAGLGAILADAMAYAHDLGFTHRDLKPDNILFNGGGPLVIADWGLGYFIHKHSKVLQQLTRGGMGTEYYCSLEQWSTGKCDGRGDIYSLGMTLDEMVTGAQRSIVVGMGLNGPATAETSAGAKRFNGLLQSMTQFLPDYRPASMREIASELRAAVAAG